MDAVVLAGGGGTRLGGVDKAGLRAGGVTLLDGVLAALGAARAVVVVGPPRPVHRPVHWTREDPPGAGPVAGLAAGLAALPAPRADTVALAAADLVHFGQSTVDRLRDALAAGDVDGAVLRDPGGRDQWLAGVWRTASLLAALPADPVNAALYRTLRTLRVTRVEALPGEAQDVDTPADRARLTDPMPPER